MPTYRTIPGQGLGRAGVVEDVLKLAGGILVLDASAHRECAQYRQFQQRIQFLRILDGKTHLIKGGHVVGKVVISWLQCGVHALPHKHAVHTPYLINMRCTRPSS